MLSGVILTVLLFLLTYRTMVLVWSEDFEALSTNRLVKVNTKGVIALVIGLQPKGRTVLAYDSPNQPDKPTTWTEAWTRWLDWMQSIGNQLHVRRSNDAQLSAIMGAHAGLQFSWRKAKSWSLCC
ncbi:hypothetical protein ACQ4PT_058681 [Festuca glaucescens]